MWGPPGKHVSASVVSPLTKADLMVKPFVHQKFLFNPRHEIGFVVFETVGRGVGARDDLSADGYEYVFVPAVGVLS